MTERMKVRELRERFEPDEVNVVRTERPRSGGHIHSPTLRKDHYRARRRGESGVQPRSLDEIVWELPLDETVIWLTGSAGDCELQVGNVAVTVEVLD